MFIIPWRNIWRNKRRTLITAASIFFAVFFSIIMRGFQMGVWLNLVDGVLRSYSGYVQIHAKGYWDNKTFDYTLSEDISKEKRITDTSLVKSFIPRLESFSLASSGERTKGAITIGIKPETEKGFMALQNRIVKGRYINEKDSGILISQGLAKYLKLNVGDSLVMISQGYQGASATGVFPILGIVKLPSPEFDNQSVFLPLALAQKFYSAEGRINSIVVDIADPKKLNETVKLLQSKYDEATFEVLSWHEMMIELYQLYTAKDGGAAMVQFMLYLIVGFGVFGTVLMMVSERKHEFAVMIALGMQRTRLIRQFGTELFYVCALGLLTGVIICIPIVVYFHYHPIPVTGDLAKSYASFGLEPYIPIAWRTDYIVQQAINVFVLVLLTLIYPLYSIFRLDVTKALRR